MALSCYARHSLRISGELAGFYPKTLDKGELGEPLPSDGIYWSISHKPAYVAGVVATFPVGIDIETIKPVSGALVKRICSEDEQRLFSGLDSVESFFRCFTAKECVVKALGNGLKGLSDVRIASVPQALTLMLECERVLYRVRHLMVDSHLASVIQGNHDTVVWECMTCQ